MSGSDISPKVHGTCEIAKKDFHKKGMVSGTPEAIEAAHKVLKAADEKHGGNPPVRAAGTKILKI